MKAAYWMLHFPLSELKYLAENTKKYPIASTVKVRANMNIPLDAGQTEIEKVVLDKRHRAKVAGRQSAEENNFCKR